MHKKTKIIFSFLYKFQFSLPRQFVQSPAFAAPPTLFRVVEGAGHGVAGSAVEQVGLAHALPGGLVAGPAVAALVPLEVRAAADWVRLREPRARRWAVAVPDEK